MKKIILFLLVLIAFSCTKQTASDKQQEEDINPFHTPYKQYVIQPYNMSIEEGISSRNILELLDHLNGVIFL